MGDEVLFLTGLDEHGQKVQQSARAQGVEPKQFVELHGQITGQESILVRDDIDGLQGFKELFF